VHPSALGEHELIREEVQGTLPAAILGRSIDEYLLECPPA
jgi:hypothetical protein